MTPCRPRLPDDGLPACAITTLDDLEVIVITSNGHLVDTIS